MNWLFSQKPPEQKQLKRFTQKLAHPDSKTFIGKGKLEEIRKYVEGKDIRIVIFDDELSGSQITNIEKVLDCKDHRPVGPDPGYFCPQGQDGPGQTTGGACTVPISATPDFGECGNIWKDWEVESEPGVRVKQKLKRTVVL